MGPKYSRDEEIAAIQRCFADTEIAPLRQVDYRRWYSSVSDRRLVPHYATFGTASDFVALCGEADVAATRTDGPTTGIQHSFNSKRSVERVIRRFVLDAELKSPLAADYEKWRQQQSDPLPNLTTVRSHLGDWPSVLRRLGIDCPASRQTAPYGSRSMESLAALLCVVEERLGKPPSTIEWDKLRKREPELGLPHSRSVRGVIGMRWRDFVDPERTWPDGLQSAG